MAGGVLGTDDIGSDFFRRVPLAQGADDFHFFITHAVGGQIGRRLHGHQAEKLEQVVLHHVPQRAGGVIISAAAAFHAEVFGAGDLDVVDVLAVPERLEDRVRKPQHHEVLRGFLAEVVVDPVGVPFFEGGVHHFIEMTRRGEVGAEGFFNNHPCPATFRRLVEPGVFQVDEDLVEELRCGRNVKQTVAIAAAGAVDFIEFRGEALVSCGIMKLRLMIVDGFDERLPNSSSWPDRETFRLISASPARNSSSDFSRRAKPTIFTPGRKLAIDRQIIRAGISLRCVRSPVAPKITTVQGSAIVAGDEVFAKRIHGVEAEMLEF